ncbi:PREDICTED: aspartic proteinase nepenthesin-1 [Erythranthe guttata]|uniref:aspartic proteinase nepenthesin-1 n=1 Tax=Erythranthe guttata TaxID=4155 RepID=UPI00064DBAFE|nr:PREDICTED: aspartic proteinase nepenthesin-1 [Erythranthe guttata]|eukprot:XP_012830436.1 PREDICTED: aspartic proteinase nepenthesin-1 [Erythranthe guttata]
MTEPLKEVRDGYIISLNLGTPPQIIQVYLDTGSDLTWVPCGNLSFDCIDCNDYKNNKLLTASISFSPSHSSSSLRDSCSSPFCTDIHSSDNSFDTCTIAGCSLTTLLRSTCYRPCPPFAYTYGEGVVAGTLTRDTLRVHATTNSISRDIPRFCFGCVGSTYREPIGIAGFGKGPLSLPSQLGFLHKGFSHCFLPFKYANNPNISSPLVVGDLAISSKEYMQFTPMLKSPIMYPNYYYIGLEAVTVGNVSTAPQVTLREFDSFGNGGMIIDSGTTYTHLPEPFYSQLLSILESVINYPRATEVEERSGFDLCYRIPCKSNNILGDEDELPLISFHFLNNVSITLPQGNCFYAMGAPSNYSVAKCLLFQSMDDDDDRYYGPAGVFGSFQQQNVEVVYDLDKERIGFQVADCANFPAL